MVTYVWMGVLAVLQFTKMKVWHKEKTNCMPVISHIQIDEWMNEWMNEWMYECMNEWMDDTPAQEFIGYWVTDKFSKKCLFVI